MIKYLCLVNQGGHWFWFHLSDACTNSTRSCLILARVLASVQLPLPLLLDALASHIAVVGLSPLILIRCLNHFSCWLSIHRISESTFSSSLIWRLLIPDKTRHSIYPPQIPLFAIVANFHYRMFVLVCILSRSLSSLNYQIFEKNFASDPGNRFKVKNLTVTKWYQTEIRKASFWSQTKICKNNTYFLILWNWKLTILFCSQNYL